MSELQQEPPDGESMELVAYQLQPGVDHELIAALAETYDVAEDDIREDVYTVVEQLRQAGVLSSPLGSP